MPVGPLQANCYLVFDERGSACAIDPGGEPERLARIIQQKNLVVVAIFVTHGHFDHVEGVKGLQKSTGAPVYCSFGVAPVLKGEVGCSATGLPIPALEEAAIRIVDEEAKVPVGELTVEIISTPGHTPWDLTYEIGGHLFTGDLIFYRSVGRTDFPGGDFGRLLESVKKLAARYPGTTPLHPGHMQSTTLGEELAFNPFLGGLELRG